MIHSTKFFQTLVALGAMLGLASTASASGPALLSAVQLEQIPDGRQIRIQTSAKPAFQRFTMQQPFRLILDILNTRPQGVQPYQSLGDGLVESVRVEPQGASGTEVSRVTLTFRRETDLRVLAEGNDVIVHVANPAGAAGDVPAPAEIRVAQAEPVADTPVGDNPDGDDNYALTDGPRSLDLVGYRFMTDSSRVFIRTNDKVQYMVRKVGSDRIIVELQDTTIPLRNNERYLDTQYFAGNVKGIQPELVEGGTPTARIEIQLKVDVQFTEKQVKNEIWIDVPN